MTVEPSGITLKSVPNPDLSTGTLISADQPQKSAAPSANTTLRIENSFMALASLMKSRIVLGNAMVPGHSVAPGATVRFQDTGRLQATNLPLTNDSEITRKFKHVLRSPAIAGTQRPKRHSCRDCRRDARVSGSAARSRQYYCRFGPGKVVAGGSGV
jgi:hypothetical protein